MAGVPAVNGRDLLDWPPLFRLGSVTPGTFFSYLLLCTQFSFAEVSDERFASRRSAQTPGPLRALAQYLHAPVPDPPGFTASCLRGTRSLFHLDRVPRLPPSPTSLHNRTRSASTSVKPPRSVHNSVGTPQPDFYCLPTPPLCPNRPGPVQFP